VYLQGPFGQFSYAVAQPGATPRPVVAIAGGIGITPLHSMIIELITRHDPRPITLLYANKRQADMAFKDQFNELTQQLPQQFKVVYVVTRADAANWQGETGHISIELINKHVDQPVAAEYYICGPQPMMQATIKLLRDRGVPRNQIHFELFSLV
jgi:ferredoxin-NADP reductase